MTKIKSIKTISALFLAVGLLFVSGVSDAEASQSPSVTTHSATQIEKSSATLNGYFDPHSNYSYGWFEWGTSSSLGNTTSKIGSSSSKQFDRTITGLNSNTTYYYRAVAENDYGREYGQVRSFTTGKDSTPQGQSPSVTTHSATQIEKSSATLNGYFDPHSNYSYGWFEWGTSSSLGNTTSKIGSSSSKQFDRTITGLNSNTTYYYRAVAENDYGREYGQVRSFTTGKSTNVYGDVYCDFITNDSIVLKYDFSNGENVSLFRDSTKLNTWSWSSAAGSFTDSGLSANTSYRYYLRNGTSSNSTVIDSVVCRTNALYVGTEDISVRNLVRDYDNVSWSDSVTISPGSKVSIRIEVRSIGSENLNNVIVRNILPDRIDYLGNLMVDGVTVSGDIVSGLNIGKISAGDMKVVTFDAVAKEDSSFGIGSTNLINSAFASAGGKNVNDTSKIFVVKGIVAGAATSIKTGITNNRLIDFILLPLFATLIIFLLFRGQFEAFSSWIDERKEIANERKAKKKLEEIRELAILREKLN